MILKTRAANGASSFGSRTELRADVVVTHDRRHVERRRQVVHDGVEQRLDPLVLEGRPAEDRLDVPGDRGPPQRVADLLVARASRRTGTSRGGRRRSRRRSRPAARGPSRPRREGPRGSRSTSYLEPRLVVLEVDRLHVDEIDDPAVSRPRSPRGSGSGRAWRSASSFIISTQRREIGADPVHLVDEGDARHVVAVGLAPDRLGLRLDAARRRRRRRRRRRGRAATARPRR